MNRIAWLLFLPTALLGASAGPDDLVRRGNAALARGDPAAALRLLDQAEDHTTDPGLVAFNKGVVFARQQDFARAEEQFRLSKQDAVGTRRACTLYNLATCLVQQAGDRDVNKLTEAISLFEECLTLEETDADLADRARHNLELAKFLWVAAQARPADNKDDRSPEDDPSRPPPKPEDVRHASTGDPSHAKGGGQKTPVRPEPGQDVIATPQPPAPGKGNLNVILDSDELARLSPEEAEQYLRQAVERVLEERRAHQRRGLKTPGDKVRDW